MVVYLLKIWYGQAQNIAIKKGKALQNWQFFFFCSLPVGYYIRVFSCLLLGGLFEQRDGNSKKSEVCKQTQYWKGNQEARKGHGQGDRGWRQFELKTRTGTSQRTRYWSVSRILLLHPMASALKLVFPWETMPILPWLKEGKSIPEGIWIGGRWTEGIRVFSKAPLSLFVSLHSILCAHHNKVWHFSLTVVLHESQNL